MEEYLEGGFIYGVGINSEQLTIEIANNSLVTTYKIWIDGSFVCELKNKFANKGLSDDEIELLTLNQLKYFTIVGVELNDKEDLLITFDNHIVLKILGSNPDVSCLEPYRIYQQTPETKPILIVCNK
jgi:hypothetical protein